MKRHLEVRGAVASDQPKHSREEDNVLKRLKRRREMLIEDTGKDLNQRNIHSRDLRIQFTEADHKYTDENGTVFRISVSGLKGLCTPAFQIEDAIRSKFQYPTWSTEKNCFVVGKKNEKSANPKDFGLSRFEVIEKMRLKSQTGTRVHKMIEDYFLSPEWEIGMPTEKRMHILTKDTGLVSDGELNCLNQFLTVEDHILSEGWRPKRVEHRIFAEHLNLAGTVDMLWVKGDDHIVVDWKTTDKDVYKPYNWKVKVFDFPLDSVTNCLLNEYFIQMSIYAVMYTDWYKWNCVSVWAAVLNPEKHHVYGLPIYKSEVLTSEVDLLFDCWKNYIGFEDSIIKWCGLEGGKTRLTLLSAVPGFGPYRCTKIAEVVNIAFCMEGLQEKSHDPDSVDYKTFCVPVKLFTIAHLLVYGKMRFRQKLRKKRILKEKTELEDHNEWYEICQNIEVILRDIGISSDETICNVLSLVCGMDTLDLSMHTMKEDGDKNFFPTLRGRPVAFKPLLENSKYPEDDARCLLLKNWGTFNEIVTASRNKGPGHEDTIQTDVNLCLSTPVYGIQAMIENELQYY